MLLFAEQFFVVCFFLFLLKSKNAFSDVWQLRHKGQMEQNERFSAGQYRNHNQHQENGNYKTRKQDKPLESQELVMKYAKIDK